MKRFFKCFGRRPSKEKEVLTTATEDDAGIREFSWEEMERWTGGFRGSRVIGSGGFSTVYLAELDRRPAAVKVVYGRRVFEDELEILRQLQHRRVVTLIGFSRCPGDDQLGALVLSYVSNGTLQDKLATEAIPWSTRMRVAYQMAEALEYLHERCSSVPVVHGDVKPANVLLDASLDARLCDFGSSKMGFSAAVAASMSRAHRKFMVGSPGYTDPHYLRTGIPSKKNDVYGFGALLLHLVTGAQPVVDMSVDPRLAGHFDREEAAAMLGLVERCVQEPPSLRPCASQILQELSSACASSLSVSSKHCFNPIYNKN